MERALEKARREYYKYQETTLSSVEKEYIKAIKNINEIVKPKTKR